MSTRPLAASATPALPTGLGWPDATPAVDTGLHPTSPTGLGWPADPSHTADQSAQETS